MRSFWMALLLAAAPAAAQVALAQPVAEPPAAQRVVPGGRAGWVADGRGGCWVWAGGLEAGASNLTASWSAGCPQGPAEGTGRSVVEWQVRGQRREMIYEGRLASGKAAGPGRLDVTEDGELVSREVGEYHDDRLVRGRLELPRLGLVYEGGWHLGQPHGEGELRSGGEVFRGAWEMGCLRRGDAWISFTRPPEQCEGQAT